MEVGTDFGYDGSTDKDAFMSRALNRMTARKVASLKEPGRHADGGGLYLRITPGGARSWVFMTASHGKRTEIGLGAEAAIPLVTARKLAADMREAVATGIDPREVIAPKPLTPAPEVITFGAFAETYIASVEEGWRNDIHRQQWRNSLRDHAGSLKDKPIKDICTEDVLAVLQPIWLSKSETASRVRGRIERILAAAKARGLRPLDAPNPAQWKGHLDVLLPRRPKLTRGHHEALPWRDAPTFMAQLRKRTALAARALEFTILTAARSGETLGATWGEIDFDQKLWTIPAKRMKAGAEHVVPLSGAAIALLLELKPEAPAATDLIFAVGGAARSNMAMAMLLRRMGQSVTTHGMRSTFRDWAGDATEFPRDLVEQALAHTISNKAERAYRRGTAIERRRGLMDAWEHYLTGSTTR
ncbi:tyrosine-type recombinase/integrase [Flavisphingomonas formosensis]|uniref:tyrosine-type recombinase/integrase n=1 Tax=Flavisphingomonas formosensis TaxID=861534 RepID=UPI001E610A12|nr:site-specific integrase [Sphingomonas formosensis]